MSEFPPPSGKPEHSGQSRVVERMLTGIQQAAKARDFMRADQLHAELIATAPMALSEIIKASRSIEEAKSAGMDKDHLAMWQKLYGSLGDGERICLYYSMKKYVLQPKTLILAHGAVNNRLFLIEKGQVTIFIKGRQECHPRPAGAGRYPRRIHLFHHLPLFRFGDHPDRGAAHVPRKSARRYLGRQPPGTI